MYDAGLFGMLAPKAYGGLELHLAECIQAWETIARIDSAAAWNLVMNQAVAAFSAWLPPKGIAELYAGGIPTMAGALHPPGKAVRVDGGGGSLVRCRLAAAATTRSGWRCRRNWPRAWWLTHE